jgi:predicted phosphate transport protein (TIGR00153 family)
LLQRLLSKDYGFFDLFDRHAATTLEAAECVCEAMIDLKGKKEDKTKRIAELEHECDSITHMTVDLLHRTFITPLDRDEILSLISKMDDVADNIDAAAHRLVLYELEEAPREVVELTQVLVRTQRQLVEVIKLLRNLKHREAIQVHCKEINSLENQGDQLHRNGVASLFRVYKHDPLMVIKLKELYEILETAIDCIEDVANIVEGIVLEHS